MENKLDFLDINELPKDRDTKPRRVFIAGKWYRVSLRLIDGVSKFGKSQIVSNQR